MDKKKYTILYNDYNDIFEHIKDIDHKNLINVKQVIIELTQEEYNILIDLELNLIENKPLNIMPLAPHEVLTDIGIPSSLFGYLKIDQAHAAGFNGSGVKVALLDSGCSDTYGSLVSNLTRLSFTNTAANIDSSGNHGSKGCVIIGQTKDLNDPSSSVDYGIANGAEVYSLKVTDGDYTDVIEAIDYCMSQSIDIINCSFSVAEDLSLKAAFNSAVSGGIIVVCSSGNNVTGSMAFPANIPGVISINGVVNSNPDVPFGSYLNTSNNVTTTIYNGGSAQVGVGGTSQAAFNLSGLLAIYKQKYPSLNTEKAIRLLQRRSTPFDGFTYNLPSNTRGVLLNNQTGAGFIAPIN